MKDFVKLIVLNLIVLLVGLIALALTDVRSVGQAFIIGAVAQGAAEGAKALYLKFKDSGKE
ncbi:MAG: hypothetical protein BWY21_02209 [Parcubacteria group bacterium ADurb.Bin216]|nr:MAG: hypothetical protein BWY21_02209 [Parcubacteria group bacterium ADurb.Bin216]